MLITPPAVAVHATPAAPARARRDAANGSFSRSAASARNLSGEGTRDPDGPNQSDFSAHARRRLAVLLRLKLLELREERLDRVRAVIERRLSPDALFQIRQMTPTPP